mgnify:CR=1 FL=1
MSLSFLFAMDTRIAFLLVDVVDPVFFTSSGFRRFSFGIADDAVADAFPFVCREADFVEDFLSYGLSSSSLARWTQQLPRPRE